MNTAPRIMIVQPDASNPVGPLGDWLTEVGAVLEVVDPSEQSLPRTVEGYQALICLGGRMSTEDQAQHLWLGDIRQLMSSAMTSNVPILGVCLGAQLLALSIGGHVTRGGAGPEAGPSLMFKKDSAWVDPLFADLPLVQDVMHFHQDVIDRLPYDAEVLASSSKYPNQAFRWGKFTYGIQFHVETTTDVVLNWVKNEPGIAQTVPETIFDKENLDRAHEDIAETWCPFAHRFVALMKGDLSPADGHRRGLPLL